MELKEFERIVKENISEITDTRKEEQKEIREQIKGYIERAGKGNIEQRRLFINFIKVTIMSELDIYKIDHITQKEKIGCIKLDESLVDTFFNELGAREKFEILLYKNRKLNSNGYDEAFKNLVEKYPIYCKERIIKTAIPQINKRYEYTADDIEKIYQNEKVELNYNEKVEILAQRVYEDLYGLGCIDILSYSNVNEVGISGSGRYIYCWCDKKIWLSFLSISESECRLIQERATKFDLKSGQLCESNPEINCYREDQARVTVFQKPFLLDRHLRIRLFNKKASSFSELITSKKQQLLIQFLVSVGEKGVLQGEMGVGKTTFMQNFIEIIPDTLHIGSIEDYFEQFNSLKYQNKCIVEAQTIEDRQVGEKFIKGKSLMDALKSLLRSSVDIFNVGEMRDGEATFTFIQGSQALKNTSLCTLHSATPEDTVPRLKNMLIATGKYFSEQAAVTDIVNYVNIIYQNAIIDGKRMISETTEIVPLIEKYSKHDLQKMDIEELQKMALIQQIQNNTAYMYTLNPILVYDQEKDEFIFKNKPSQRLIDKANKNKESRALLDELLRQIEKDMKASCIL